MKFREAIYKVYIETISTDTILFFGYAHLSQKQCTNLCGRNLLPR